jgi:hypothetical protein
VATDLREVSVDVQNEVEEFFDEVEHEARTNGGERRYDPLMGLWIGGWRVGFSCTLCVIAAHKKAGSLMNCLLFKRDRVIAVLDVGLGLTQTGNAIALFPLTALLEDGYAFKTLENVTFDDDAGGALETFVL